MSGPRILGRALFARSCGRSLLIATAGALLLTGCLPEDKQAQNTDLESIVEFQKTADQVNRSRKMARLQPAESEIANVYPQTIEREIAEPVRPPEEEPVAAPVRPVNVALASFHGALRDLESGSRQKPITVLHLGDSHIASDRLTGDMRAMFQERFGDAGRGMMMPGFPFTYYRARGVRFSKSGGWKAANSFKRAGGLYGVTGVRLTTYQKNARLTLTSETGPFEWAEVAFLTGPKQGSAVVAIDGNGKVVKTRAAKASVQRIRLDHKGTKLTIRATGGGPLTVLSWSVGHNRPGIRYVNLGIPGATAETPNLWNEKFVAEDVAELDPELIVLGFGTNEGFNDGLNLEAYKDKVTALAERLTAAAPNASLAIIGPADGARLPRFARKRKSGGCKVLTAADRGNYRKLLRAGSARLAGWHAPPKLTGVRETLRRIAGDKQAHFWDWSEVMGGECGVHKWSRSKPQLASSDHVHITRAGSKRSAEAFFESLMTGYDEGRKLASRSLAGIRNERVNR